MAVVFEVINVGILHPGGKGGSSPFVANEYLNNNNAIIINNDLILLRGVTPLKPRYGACAIR
jgi:hypothetical protein